MSAERTLVIGDIHSGLRALEQVLGKAGISSDDTLIFLGDYVDGWSTAVETVAYLIQLKKEYNCIFIRGNHDELCYDWLKNDTDNPLWLQHGGAATKASYEQASAETKARHLQFFEQLENYHIDESNRLFLHAGFTDLKGVAYEYFAKNFYWDRTLWELARSLDPKLAVGDKNYPQRLKHYAEIYIGHTPVSKTKSEVRPENAANVWNIDTGAAFKGPLSVIDIDTKAIWQSEPVQHFYPMEKGRN